jgi:hypothetical protein
MERLVRRPVPPFGSFPFQRWESMPKTSLVRVHGFELHEQPWLPETLRGALTEWLRALWEYSCAEVVIAPLLQAAIVSSGAERIVDLCSGSSGPIVRVQTELALRGVRIPVILTDKFPYREALNTIALAAGGGVTACLDSIDATSVPQELTGLRTLFNSFHHFRPAEARRILRAACADRQPIGIFEVTARTLPRLALCFPASFLSCYVLIWRMRPRRAIWWMLTWVAPVLPFIVGWDALVSHLRTYTPSELRALTQGFDDAACWEWREGSVKAPKGGVEISFLIGTPILVGTPHSQ